MDETKVYQAGQDTAHGGALLTPDELCEECGHELRLHDDPYGCQYERGDAWVTGNQADQPTVLMAQGPCGCPFGKDWYAQRRAERKLREANRSLGSTR